MIDAIVIGLCVLFFISALVGFLKFWMKFEETSDRLDYVERDLQKLVTLVDDVTKNRR